MEVLWKTISVIINLSSIQFHDYLHGFRAGRITGTATLEAKLLHQIIAMREMVLHSIFIDLRKAYKYLDMEHCLDILTGYGVGPKMLHNLRTYWDWLQIAEKSGGHYGPEFQSHCRVTQGDPLSPTIFNVVVEYVIQHWVTVVPPPQEGTGQGLGESIQTLAAIFYANYRLVASPESARLQGAFNVLTGLFDRVGLHNNEGKIVSMACRSCHTPTCVVNGVLHSASDRDSPIGGNYTRGSIALSAESTWRPGFSRTIDSKNTELDAARPPHRPP